MANIYNDTANIQNNNGIFKDLVAENAAIDNLQVDNSLVTTGIDVTGISNHSIVTAGVNGSLQGLLPGSNNDVLISNGTDALWTNSLVLQNTQTNTLKIPTTTTGDILVFNSSSEAQRFAVGTSGTFLISDGTNPTWNPLPNPLILGSLQVNNNLQLSTFSNRRLMTDNTGFVVSERIQYTSGTFALNTTPTQIYDNFTWFFTQNAWYSLKFQITSNSSQVFIGQIYVSTFLIGSVYAPNYPNTWFCDFTYNHTLPSGIYNLVLTNFVTTAGTAGGTFSMRVERIPTPLIHL